MVRWEILKQRETLSDAQASIAGCNNIEVPGLPEGDGPLKEVAKVVSRLTTVTGEQIPRAADIQPNNSSL